MEAAHQKACIRNPLCYALGMGFYVANETKANAHPSLKELWMAGRPPRSGTHRRASGRSTPLEKTRLGFFSRSRFRAGFSVTQAVETHREKSAKPTNIASGVRYYGYRYYSPSLGRWLSRDPITEEGLLTVDLYRNIIRIPSIVLQDYALCKNSPICLYDVLGLDPCQDAKDMGKDMGNLGGIVCSRGKAYPCVWIENEKDVTNDQAKNIVSKCAMDHEQTHLADTVCPPCGLSRGAAPTSVITSSECRGYTIELNCLNSESCNGNVVCQRQVVSRKRLVEKQKRKYCQTNGG